MVYDWEGKEDICYRMYIEDKKSLEEIMEYMKDAHHFAPRYSRLLLNGTQHLFWVTAAFTSSLCITLPYKYSAPSDGAMVTDISSLT